MAVKKTIAIVGATEKTGRAIVNQFACMPYRLLLVSNKINELEQLINNISDKYPKAEVESLECVKDGCWEADIIIIAVAPSEEVQVAEMVKEVATQKIVVVVSEKENECRELGKILPYSKVIKAYINVETREILFPLQGEAVNEEISKIFNLSG